MTPLPKPVTGGGSKPPATPPTELEADMTEREWLRSRMAEALAERFTVSHGARNPEWDIDGPDDETNPYYLPIPMSERIENGQMYVHFTASDGHASFRATTVLEAVDALLESPTLQRYWDGQRMSETTPMSEYARGFQDGARSQEPSEWVQQQIAEAKAEAWDEGLTFGVASISGGFREPDRFDRAANPYLRAGER